MAAEEVLLRRPGAADAGGAPQPAADCWRSTSPGTIRCSAGPTPRSAPKRAACTSARARRSCSRCPGPSAARLPAGGVDDCRTAAARRAGAVRRRRHEHRRPRPVRGRAAAERADRGLAAIAAAVQKAQKRFDTESDDATLQPLLTGLARRSRAARRSCARMPIDEAAVSRSTSACGRRNASFSRPFFSPAACTSRRSPTTAWSYPDSRSACR